MWRRIGNWTVAILILAAGLLLVVFGADVVSYGRVAWNRVQTAATPEESISQKLFRAEALIQQIALREAELVGIVATDQVRLARARTVVARQTRELADLRSRVTVDGSTSDAASAQQIARREHLLQTRKSLLQAQERALKQTRDALEQTQLKKLDLESQLKKLYVQQRKLQRQAVDKSQHTAFAAKADALLKDVRFQLDVAQRVREMESLAFSDVPPLIPIPDRTNSKAASAIGSEQNSAAGHSDATDSVTNQSAPPDEPSR